MYKLRELSQDDILIINEWRNDKELIDNLGAPFRYIDLKVDENWYLNYMKNRSKEIRCSIVSSVDNIMVGLISLTDINHINQSAKLHLMIGNKSYRSKGIGSYAINSIVEHAFNNLNIQRIELDVLSYNTRAIHVYEKNGFQIEGVRRKSFYKNGEFVDSIIMSRLK